MRTLLMLAAALLLFIPSSQAQIAVKGETVYTMAGDPIKNGSI